MKYYKAFNENLQCRGFQYEVGETYELEKGKKLGICKCGFHFCKTVTDCFDYYPKNKATRFCEVEPLGKIVEEGNKFATDKIKIIRELTEEEINNGNVGVNNVGWCNEGDYNKGDYNKGDSNKGDSNKGDYNEGNSNEGNSNKGDSNKGDSNEGNSNEGDYNEGDYNEGNSNEGDSNKGDSNKGDYNKGDYNIGVANKGDYQCGVGCTNAPLMLFNKPSKHTLKELYDSGAIYDIIHHTLTPRVIALDTFDMEVWEELGK